MTIPADLELSTSERGVLSKGLKFIPKEKRHDDFTVKKDLETFYRRIKLHSYFNNADKNIRGGDPQYKPKSSWTPHDIPTSSVTKYITKCKEDIQKLDLHKLHKYNLSLVERTTLSDLRKREDSVVKPADKGGAVVV